MSIDSAAPQLHPGARSISVPLVSATFALFGLLFGMWQVALADLQASLELSTGALGAALTSGFVASFPMMLLGGRLADRWGVRVLITGSALLLAVALVGVVGVTEYGTLIVLLIIFFGASGAYDVGINAAAIDVEQYTGRRLMAYLHALFSGGAAVGALLAGGLLWLGVHFRFFYFGLALLQVLLAFTVWRKPSLDPLPHERMAMRSSGLSPTLYRSLPMLSLALLTALGYLSEGTLESWSAIYLRSALHLPAVLGALGPAVFHTAMLLGRLGTGWLNERLGRRWMLRVGGLLTATGMLLALATTNPLITLLGLLATGLALSGIVPTAFSLAGDLAPDRKGEASSLLTTIGYAGFLLGPALIGGLADAFGLRVALSVIILMGLLILLLSGWVRKEEMRQFEY